MNRSHEYGRTLLQKARGEVLDRRWAIEVVRRTIQWAEALVGKPAEGD